MSWLSSAFGWLFGRSAAGTVHEVGQVVDNLTTTDKERGDLEIAEGAQVRAFAAPADQPGALNVVVDAYNRLLRPVITTWIAGGFMGFWDLPAPSKFGPEWWGMFVTVATFWFGGRILFRDLPATLEKLAKVKKIWR